ncbi:MAG: hypothetical protein K2H30_01255 [Clostridia bacterium]|nr:hypothetical protein [Clostridia bacterium]
METGIEFKEKQIWRFIETFGGAFWALILPAAAVILGVFVDYSALGTTEIACIAFAYIIILILEITAIKLFCIGLNDFYFHGKTALIVYDDCLQILERGKKLFKYTFVTVDYKDISDFTVCRTKTLWRCGDYMSGKVYKVKNYGYGVIEFKDNKSNKCLTASIHECMKAAELIAKNLDVSQIAQTDNDLNNTATY